MPRIRSIHYDACKSEKLDAASAEAERCYWRLAPHCDDDGRTEDDPRILRSAMFPISETITSVMVNGWLDELASLGLIVRYVSDGRRYLAVTKWGDYQKPQKKLDSKLPPPPELSSNGTRPLRDTSGNAPVALSLGVGEGEGVGGGNGASAVPDVRVQELVAGYVEDFQRERVGHNPNPRWRAAAGKAAKEALAAGESVKDIAGCFYVIAHEGKNPATLPYVLADSHQGRERRML